MSSLSLANDTAVRESYMIASGSFEIKLDPQDDQDAPAGRMIIRKKYSGDLQGDGTGQMLSKRTEKGTAAYSAIEEFEGSISGKSGAFTFIHTGYMSADGQSLEVKILPGSGTEEFANITGSLEITQEEGKHRYVLTYDL